ncbi:MAG: tetratricopeptide repeat protein [Saprospiraceae bacterium]|nr:tetratricopeptide repeat protein [Saprospiraceae bacterium]
MLIRNIVSFLLIFCFSAPVFAQDPNLANQYFQDGEYEKAAFIYEELYKKFNNNEYYFNQYVESLLKQSAFEECEKVIRKELKSNPKEVHYYAQLGNLLERQGREKEAEDAYKEGLKKMPADQSIIFKFANVLTTLVKYDLAIEAYEKGVFLLKDSGPFAYNLADLYKRKGDTPKMIYWYLTTIGKNSDPTRVNTLKTVLQRTLTDDDWTELQGQLYAKLQEEPSSVPYTELLTWVFVQKKDYTNAFRQAKALDRMLNENGLRLFDLANIAFQDKDYDAAITIYEYIINEKGPQALNYLDAKTELLRVRRSKLVSGFSYTESDLRKIEKEYEDFLNIYTRNKVTAPLLMELANLEAVYLNDLDKATSILEEVIAFPGLDAATQAQAKLDLGDYYLMKGDIWEATLLYSQVDKAFKEETLGQDARFRNAKLSYYAGDFQWAQAQFDILKSATSKLLSNDAIDLSVFIMDNLGLDTIAAPLQMYADAELLTFQNKFSDAFLKLDSILILFPKHSLDDDILYLKAQVYRKQKNYDKAIEMYQNIIDNFKEEIRCDNAIFELAQMYDFQLNQPEKAQSLYEKLFTDYSNSFFSVEARKRYRILRGDKVQ